MIMQIRALLQELKVMLDQLIILKVFNQSATSIVKSPVQYLRMKHIELQMHYMRHCLGEDLDLQYIPTQH